MLGSVLVLIIIFNSLLVLLGSVFVLLKVKNWKYLIFKRNIIVFIYYLVFRVIYIFSFRIFKCFFVWGF